MKAFMLILILWCSGFKLSYTVEYDTLDKCEANISRIEKELYTSWGSGLHKIFKPNYVLARCMSKD